MDNLTPEQYRVLQKRIAKALEKAKYSPGDMGYDLDQLAIDVVWPYRPRYNQPDGTNHNQEGS